MNHEWEKKRIEELTESIGFYGLVGIVRSILNKHYPKDLFGASPDVGARFSQKLHEAIDILDEANQDDDNAPQI